jgi:hypothetical protein
VSFESIRVEGSLFSAELLERLDEGYEGQAAKDFGLGPRVRVRDAIMEAWGDLSEQWRVFQRRRERLAPGESGTTETRRFWMEIFFATLGFELEFQKQGETIQGRNYPISHRDGTRARLPVHIVGFGAEEGVDDGRSTLDRRPGRGGLSPHALVQEYLNLIDSQLFGLVTNGLVLRLMRDCGRISRLSYVEFDLERMFEGDLYSEFAVLYRFLHASRFSADPEAPEACIIEDYHQASVEEGGRIRAHLSEAVEDAILTLGNGFLEASANKDLRDAIASGGLSASEYYNELLTLVYRLLFLMVIEERGLIFGRDSDRTKTEIYDRFYSLRRLRVLSRTIVADLDRHADWYRLLGETFALFDEKGSGAALGIAPLGGDLFESKALPHIGGARLSNRRLRDALSRLDSFQDEKSRLPIRVNYAGMNVEEFGSVYEGLLELEPVFTKGSGNLGFDFDAGTVRGDTGSHYTPDELVQKLVKAAIEPAVEEVLAAVSAKGLMGAAYKKEAEAALLRLKVLDSACGSGHMLLGAARRIGLELARIRHDEEQPSPEHLRAAVREAISHCVYGVDMNPAAVELCKVALWLESHEPGKPLGFLDHRIRCGDSLAGLGRFEELEAGIPDIAFKAKPGDDKKTASALARRNAKERDEAAVHQILFRWAEGARRGAFEVFGQVESIGDDSLLSAQSKKAAYERFRSGADESGIQALADLKSAQFFLPILEGQTGSATTEGAYRACLNGETQPQSLSGFIAAQAIAKHRRFFHWFAEYPTVFTKDKRLEEGFITGTGEGFDVIIGNPPFLGGQKISGTFGDDYLAYLKACFKDTGAMDLVGFFFRRNYELLRPGGRMALIATKTIAEGGTREGGLDQIIKTGTIYWAVKSMPWPGKAAVSVSLAAIHKAKMEGPFFLNGKNAATISPYLDDVRVIGNPCVLMENAGKSFMGSIVLGMGFTLDPEAAMALIANNPKNKDVLFPYLNGEDLNARPDGSPSRWVINFFDWPLRRKKPGDITKPDDDWECVASEYDGHVAEEYPECLEIVSRTVRPDRKRPGNKMGREKWWQYYRRGVDLYLAISSMDSVMAVARTSRTVGIQVLSSSIIFSDATVVFALPKRFFPVLQSSLHYYWATKYSSSLKGDLRYSATDAFETFPFPQSLRPGHPVDQLETSMRDELEAIGKEYYEHRAALMLDLNLGLTKTYNLFHDPKLDQAMVAAALAKSGGKGDPADCIARLTRLRDLHAVMDLAVLKAYRWTDIKPDHGFYELDFLPENDRVRYTICDKARREVLERLLELNFQRHKEEMQSGADAVSETVPTAVEAPLALGEAPEKRRRVPHKLTPEELVARDKARAAEAERKQQKYDLFAPEDMPDDSFDRPDLGEVEWMCEIRKLFSSGGACDREAAIKELSVGQGYRRLGSVIRETIDRELVTAVKRGILKNESGLLSLLSRDLSDYDRDFLKQQFLSSLEGTAWRDREDAIKAFARWMGYGRTSEGMADVIKSLIKGQIREGRIEADGERIRKAL